MGHTSQPCPSIIFLFINRLCKSSVVLRGTGKHLWVRLWRESHCEGAHSFHAQLGLSHTSASFSSVGHLICRSGWSPGMSQNQTPVNSRYVTLQPELLRFRHTEQGRGCIGPPKISWESDVVWVGRCLARSFSNTAARSQSKIWFWKLFRHRWCSNRIMAHILSQLPSLTVWFDTSLVRCPGQTNLHKDQNKSGLCKYKYGDWSVNSAWCNHHEPCGQISRSPLEHE